MYLPIDPNAGVWSLGPSCVEFLILVKFFVLMAPEEREAAFVKLTDLTEEYLGLRLELSSCLKEGWFNLSQARYAAGPMRIGQHEYDLEMKASVHVAISEPTSETRFKLHEVAAQGELGNQVEEHRGDPVKWFGSFSLPNLKQAQHQFKRALQLTVALSNISYQVDQATKELEATLPVGEE